MSTIASLVILGLLCVVSFIMYAFGEWVGYLRGVEDEARRNDPKDIAEASAYSVKIAEEPMRNDVHHESPQTEPVLSYIIVGSALVFVLVSIAFIIAIPVFL